MYNSSVVSAVGDKNNSAPLGYADSFRKRFFLIFFGKQVIHGTQKKRYLVCIVIDMRQVKSVSLDYRYIFTFDGFAFEHFNVVFYQLYSVHAITLSGKIMAVSSRSRPYFDYTVIFFKVFFNIAHGGEKFGSSVL